MWSLIAHSFWGHILTLWTESRQPTLQPPEYLEKFTASESSSTTLASEFQVVGWDGQDDPANPKNWSVAAKLFVVIQVCFLTLESVMGSALYSPSTGLLKDEFGISSELALLPMALFIIGFAVGPIVLAPMSENPSVGRSSIFVTAHFIYFVLQIPQAWGAGTHSFAVFTVLRFLSGLAASPVLALGSAACGDVVNLPYLPFAIVTWSSSSVAGPCLGPVMGGALANASHSWRWCFRLQAILAAVSVVFISFFLPETYGPAILYRKVQRLRKSTGNGKLTTQFEIDHPPVSASQTCLDTLWRPLQITLAEPMVMLINLYTSLLYLIFFLWFEAFPIVFVDIYHFNIVELGCSYLAVFFGIMAGAVAFFLLIYRKHTRLILAGQSDKVTPETFMPVAIYGAFLIPVGIFIFAWTSTASVHWIVPMIGGALFAQGAFFIFQPLFSYLAVSYPRYVASVFAGNSLMRCLLAGVGPLYGSHMFRNTGSSKFPVGWGGSILGFMTVAMIGIPILFHLRGPKLRSVSKFGGL